MSDTNVLIRTKIISETVLYGENGINFEFDVANLSVLARTLWGTLIHASEKIPFNVFVSSKYDKVKGNHRCIVYRDD